MDTGDAMLNIPDAQRIELKKKAEHLFWERPIGLFEPAAKAVAGNLSDTFSRFIQDPHAKKAAQALSKSDSLRTRVGRALGERQSQKAGWIEQAEKDKHANEDERSKID